MQGKHLFAMIVAAALLPAPILANPPAKKAPACETNKAPTRDAKKVEPCRKNAPIPWVVDPTPMFLATTIASSAAASL